ncbi:ABC transporter ATP-binding protein (plasmid) [Vibrio pelagius]|uniref:ABC transporter ATP-binding protein n=1 Tax=Vibrio pelagius TaxID=28169 RepID=A0ABY5GAX0_VIBPE|nr:ABC transporter ATP-binding protein [Vibrio pelagius]UTT87226.1 ABC transporter ATP-binding protein [Vibrio pelagius]
MARIQLKSLTKKWGKVYGVNDVNLDIKDQEFVVFLGPSGCGKTTTMRMIAGLEDPSSGEIHIGDRVVNELDPKDRDVAMVFQSYGLYPNLTIYENIRFPLKVRKVDAATHDERVKRAAEMVELGDLLDRYPRELSGGQRQRVALARAVVREPTVFLMDEPLSNLDAKLRVSTRAQLKHLQHELKVTTIYVTHDQIEAMTLADRVVVMNGGEIQQVGTPTEIYNNPANVFVASFIGSPAMNLVEGTIKDGVFEAENIRISGLSTEVTGDVILGYRAEDAQVTEHQALNSVPLYNSYSELGSAARKRQEFEPQIAVSAPVYSMELLGDATMVTVKTGSALFAAKADKHFRIDIDQPISFELDVSHCHLFDKQTGQRI